MNVRVRFYSYLKDLVGVAETDEPMEERSSVGQLITQLHQRFPRLREADRCLLIAVGVEYQNRDYLLSAGDEVSLFPPVQGG